MLALRSLAFNVCFYAATTVIAFAGLPALASRRLVLHVARTWARLTLWLLRTVAGIEVEFRGLENIPPGPLLVAAKHQSALETVALCAIFPNFAYILKRELLFIPLFGWHLSRGGMVAIDRSKGTRAMALMNAAAAEAVRDGRQLIIFPEGTRRPPGAPPAYKQGLSHLYTALGVPCLPVALNTGLFWSRNSLVRRPGKAVIAFLPPIPPGLPRQEFQALALERIESASNVLIGGGLSDLSAAGHTVPASEAPAAAPRR
ncbi:lysophospholipid acyltransferase family protein [Methylobacterium sp. NEAU 140]|uniref:lysophospholipid acyltransferase family protein n=1 Tax=Methylobacterium sp. NEAU 140 TaxID=3064945 RepID=UPI002732D5D6|nr:lysophospholipid acyltransferase family protein [Methylobacterium sp. NEAU 140]MDP4022446.1 lysophospholipid acyltransferase family protein [Methylobacterium sp. NEAU 140]